MRRGVLVLLAAASVLAVSVVAVPALGVSALAVSDLAVFDLAGVPGEDGVELGGIFGRATASGTGLNADTIELDLEVEADDDAIVVAHLIEPGGPQVTLPLLARGQTSNDLGLFGIRTEVRKTDFLVVFEVVDGALPSQSQPLRLTDLGVDPALVGVLTVPPTEDEEFSDNTRLWGWAGLGLAATALTLIALWALPDRRRRAREAEAAERDAEVSEATDPEVARDVDAVDVVRDVDDVDAEDDQ